jgi:hypothetical protein
MKNMHFLYVLIILLGCSPSRIINEKKYEITVTDFIYHDGGTWMDTFDAPRMHIYEKDYFFCKNPFLIEADTFQKLPADTIYRYYLFNKNYKTGFYIDSLSSLTYKKIDKDSFTASQMYVIFERVGLGQEYTLQKKYADNGLQVQKYYLNTPADSSYSDTALIYYDDKLKNVNFSLDKRLDSINQSKCIKKRFLYYNKIKGDPKYGRVYREITSYFTVKEYTNEEELQKMIAAFDKFNSK